VQDILVTFDRVVYDELSAACLAFADRYSWSQWLHHFQQES
jgi:hypothetical protein